MKRKKNERSENVGMEEGANFTSFCTTLLIGLDICEEHVKL